MNIKIYRIEDKQGLKYIGSTKESLNQRLCRHRSKKNTNDKYKCSSRYLNLDDCTITLLEDNVEKQNRNEREQYYINNTTCVNTKKNLIHGWNKDIYDDWNSSFGKDNNLRKIDTNLFL
jgi:predicted GIY-YIG superfamily endonuclease